LPGGFEPKMSAFAGWGELKKLMAAETTRCVSLFSHRRAMSTPDYVYKLIPSHSPLPSPLPLELPLSELDSKSGFIHLSTAPQVPGTLQRFFGTDERVYILKIPLKPLQDKIRWESPDAKGASDSIRYQLCLNQA
jgi:hypothetical protein